MSLLTIEGVVENGHIRLKEDIALPEQATVYVVVMDTAPALTLDRRLHLRSPRLADADQASKLVKQVIEVSPDAHGP